MTTAQDQSFIRVKVTPEDIHLGINHSCFHCPIARAIGRALSGWPVTVNGSQIYLDRGFDTVPVDLPGEAQAFIRDFDDDRTVHPFEFILPIPDGGL